MNKHIELVKKWLADNDSVTQQELDDNRTTADAAFCAAADAAFCAADAADYAANAAKAAKAADADNADNAEYWIKRYEELKEQE